MPADFLSDSIATLARLTQALQQADVRYVDLAGGLGVGAAVAYGQNDYVVITVPGPPNDQQAYLTVGVLRDVRQDRAGLLTLCNELTSNNVAYPTYLHDADAGWDILIQQSYPAQLLVDVPPFFLSCVRGLPGAASEHRTRFANIEAGGQPYAWDDSDVNRLFTRSMV